MTLKVEGGEIVIRDNANNVKFSSGDALFTVTDFVDSRIVGAISLPEVTATADQFGTQVVDRDVSHAVTTVSSGASVVFGMMRQVITSGVAAGVGFYTKDAADGLWRQVNGTHVESFHAIALQLSGRGPTDIDFIGGLGLLTFYISGTTLYMRERLVLREFCPPSSGTYTVKRPAQNIEFRLYCGLFV